jgi:hypothetical protein
MYVPNSISGERDFFEKLILGKDILAVMFLSM